MNKLTPRGPAPRGCAGQRRRSSSRPAEPPPLAPQASPSARAGPTAEIDEDIKRRARRNRPARRHDVVQHAKTYRKDLETIVGEMIRSQEADLEKELDDDRDRSQAAPTTRLGAIHHQSGEWINRGCRSRRLLHRQHQDRPDLAAGADDQLQLRRRGPLRSLHHLPPGDRQDGARLGHRAARTRPIAALTLRKRTVEMPTPDAQPHG